MLEPPRPRTWRRDAVIVLLGGAIGGFALWMRHVGWALAWPLSWLVAVAAIAPAAASVASGAFGVWALRRARHENDSRSTRARGIAWLVAALGLGAGAYGMRGAAVSLNPFDSRLVPTSTMPPASHGVVMLVDDDGSKMLLLDLQTRGLYQWAPFTGFDPLHTIDNAWWSQASSRFIANTTADDELGRPFYETYTFAIDGSLRRALSQDGGEVCAGGSCAVLPGGRDLACVQLRFTSTAETLRACTLPLDGTRAAHVVSWDPPPSERGAAAPSADGTAVYYSDRCPGETSGDHCLFRAAFDGSARTLVGSMNGNACSIVASPDGGMVLVAARGSSYTDACSNLWRFDVASGHAPPSRIAQFLPAPENHSFSYGGVSAIAFAPDSARLAVVSDHEDGCAGSEGVSGCQTKLYTLRSDGRDFVRVTDTLPGYYDVTWLR